MLQELLKQKQAGHLAWRFIPYRAPPELPQLDEPAARVARSVEVRWGKKSRALFPFIYEYLRRRPFMALRYGDRTMLNLGGTRVEVGRPRPEASLLDDPMCSRLALVPHLTRRGPNGLWEIRRGRNHPLEVRVRDVTWFILKGERGDFDSVWWQQPRWGLAVLGLELFASEELATREARRRTREEPEEPLEVVALTGSELLDVVSHATVLELATSIRSRRTLVLDHTGTEVLGEHHEVDSGETLLTALCRTAAPQTARTVPLKLR